MTIQTQTTSISLREFTFCFPTAQPVHSNSCDYGFDFDEEVLGAGLLASLPVSISIQPPPEIDVDEFEHSFQYFIS